MHYFWQVALFLDNPVIQVILITALTFTLWGLLSWRHRRNQRLARMLYRPTKAEARINEHVAELHRKYDDLVDAIGTARNVGSHNGRELVKLKEMYSELLEKLGDYVDVISDDTPTEKIPDPPSLFEQMVLGQMRKCHADTWQHEYRKEFINQVIAASEKAYEQQCAYEGQQELERRKRQNSVANISVMGVDGEEKQAEIGGYYQAKEPELKCPACGSHNIRGGHSKIDGTTVCTCNECEHRWEV